MSIVDYIVAAETQKTALAANLTTMGQAAANTETLAALVGKVLDISDDADAVASDIAPGKTAYSGGEKITGTATAVDTTDATAGVGDILSGETAYAVGSKLTGTMPNNAGDVAAVSYHAGAAGEIHVVPAAGYTDGTDDAVVITDADFVAGNIADGVTIFGITGTASGSATLTGDASALDVMVGKTFYKDSITKLTGHRRPVFAAGANTNAAHRYDNRDMHTESQAGTFGEAIRSVISDATRLFVSGDARAYVRYYPKYTLATYGNTGNSSNGSINGLAINGTYLFGGGDYGFARWALSNLAEAPTNLAYGGTLFGVTALGDYLYGAGGTIQKVWKVQISDMTKVAESADYGGLPRAICNDGTYIYMGGGTVCKVYKYSASDLSKLAESAVIGDGILGLWADSTHVYAVSSSGQKVVKLLASDLSTVTESAAYGGGVYGITGDDNYIYAGGTTPQKVFMYRKSDLSKVAESAAYGGDLLAFCI